MKKIIVLIIVCASAFLNGFSQQITLTSPAKMDSLQKLLLAHTNEDKEKVKLQ